MMKYLSHIASLADNQSLILSPALSSPISHWLAHTQTHTSDTTNPLYVQYVSTCTLSCSDAHVLLQNCVCMHLCVCHCVYEKEEEKPPPL